MLVCRHWTGQWNDSHWSSLPTTSWVTKHHFIILYEFNSTTALYYMLEGMGLKTTYTVLTDTNYTSKLNSTTHSHKIYLCVPSPTHSPPAACHHQHTAQHSWSVPPTHITALLYTHACKHSTQHKHPLHKLAHTCSTCIQHTSILVHALYCAHMQWYCVYVCVCVHVFWNNNRIIMYMYMYYCRLKDAIQSMVALLKHPRLMVLQYLFRNTHHLVVSKDGTL